ncbi:hypothetical protein FRB94_005808 [Tulasnella sp. JGI-2019a]|nr:hypothetical protein FRB93_011428 [Tulasnella sp. JGI-2019a]KAG9012491.1 hypothetical protein FRB94_005808 [Tulasnella sp. JGI-2019a]
MADLKLVLGRLKLAIVRRSRGDHDIATPWTFLHRALDGDMSFDHWMGILDSKCIPEMVENLTPKTIRYEPAAASRSIACLYMCHAVGSYALKQSEYDLDGHEQRTTEALELIEDSFPSLLVEWWTRYRHLVPLWLDTGLYMPFCMSAMVMFRAAANRRDPPSTSTYREMALTVYPTIRDALVTYALLAPCRTEEERYDVVGNCSSPLDLTARIPSDEEKEMPTVHLLLRRTPDLLYQRVKLLLGDYARQDFPAVMVFIRWLGLHSDLHASLATGGDLTGPLISSFWGMCQLPPENFSRCFRDCAARMVLKAVLLLLLESGQRCAVQCTRLLNKLDFLSLIEKVAWLTAANPSVVEDISAYEITAYEITPGVWSKLRNLLIGSREALLPPLRRDFLCLLDHLRTLIGDQTKTLENIESSIEWWEDLGKEVGVTECDLRSELCHDHEEVIGVAIGCSWFKCMMYEQECDPTGMFRCAGCSRAMYCGIVCQSRDWDEGNHQSTCQKEPNEVELAH